MNTPNKIYDSNILIIFQVGSNIIIYNFFIKNHGRISD